MYPTVERRRHLRPDPWTYEALDRRQREVQTRVLGDRLAPGALLLSEVAPVITLGRRTPESDLVLPGEAYSRMGVGIHHTDRGGLATYHGPGQWVLFAVDRLDRLTGDPRGVRKAVEGLLEIAQRVAIARGHRAEVRSGAETGVWTPQGKFAAVGVHIERGVILHGLAINGFQTSLSFSGLRPCGLDSPIAFLLRDECDFEQLGSELEAEALRTFWHQN